MEEWNTLKKCWAFGIFIHLWKRDIGCKFNLLKIEVTEEWNTLKNVGSLEVFIHLYKRDIGVKIILKSFKTLAHFLKVTFSQCYFSYNWFIPTNLFFVPFLLQFAQNCIAYFLCLSCYSLHKTALHILKSFRLKSFMAQFERWSIFQSTPFVAYHAYGEISNFNYIEKELS